MPGARGLFPCLANHGRFCFVSIPAKAKGPRNESDQEGLITGSEILPLSLRQAIQPGF